MVTRFNCTKTGFETIIDFSDVETWLVANKCYKEFMINLISQGCTLSEAIYSTHGFPTDLVTNSFIWDDIEHWGEIDRKWRLFCKEKNIVEIKI